MRSSPGLAASPPQAPPPEEATAIERPSSYLELYGLAQRPFAGSAGRFQLFPSQRAVLDSLVTGMLRDDGHLVLVGEATIGKTTLLDIASRLVSEQNRRIIRVERNRPDLLTRASLFRQILAKDAHFDLANDVAASLATARLQAPPDEPRKILVIDDAHYLTSDALAWITEIAGKEGNASPRIVLAGTHELRGLLRDQACRPLFDRVKAVLQVSRLTPGESRQYIEQHFWEAGSSTRKLITPRALREILRRADGRPGQINNLLEGVLSAGFLRGDATITPRTVRAAADLPSTFHRARKDHPRRLPWVAILILLLGLGAFSYRLINGANQEPPAATDALSSGLVQPAASADELIRRGDASLSAGNVADARIDYQQAAQSGSGAGATAMGKTFDPNVLAHANPAGTEPNPALATYWYRRAVILGDDAATPLLHALGPQANGP